MSGTLARRDLATDKADLAYAAGMQQLPCARQLARR